MKKKKNSGLSAVLSELNNSTASSLEEAKAAGEDTEAAKETPETEKIEAVPDQTPEPEAAEGASAETAEEEEPREETPVLTEGTSRRVMRRKRSRREIWTAVLGILTSFFVVVGIVSSVCFVVDTTKNMIDSTELKEELAYAVFPLVIVDAPEFESPQMLESSVIVSSSIWRLILDADMNSYVKNDVGGITVPDADIELYIRQLYGSEVPIVHQTVPDASVQMSYSAEDKSYLIESTPTLLPYTPRVDEVKRDGDIYTVRVSYILPDVTWSLTSHRNEVVEKVMQFTVKKVDHHYQMLSSKLLEVVNDPNAGVSGNPEQITDSTPEELMASAAADRESSETPDTPAETVTE